jgi:hypothetical protein
MTDAQRLKEVLRERVEDLARYLFPNGRQEGVHWCVGDVTGDPGHSFKICLAGEKAGLWGDFAHSQKHSRNLLDLWMQARNVDFKTALREAAEWTGCELHSANGKIPLPSKPKSTAAFRTLDEAVAWAERKLKMCATRRDWYQDRSGNQHFVVVRFDAADWKDFRPFHQNGSGWLVSDPPGKLPLFRLPELIEKPTDRVFVVEGEKCARELATLGLLVTTSAHGANSAHKTDWGPLAGRKVIILPDNDQQGRAYAETVAGILYRLSPLALARIVELPGVPPKGDCVDWLEARDAQTPEDIRAELLDLVDRAEVVEASRTDADEQAGPEKSFERGATSNGLQGSEVTFPEIEPWLETVCGAKVLAEVSEAFSCYVILPAGAADVLALWCAHAHSFEAFQCSPRLNINSPEKGCGKTTLRDVIALFVPRPLLSENITTAVLFRVVQGHAPTILADEYDAWLGDNEELRGLFNAGHRRGAKVYRCEGKKNEVRGFAAYAPAVLCGIGALPGTLHDRSIVIRVERAKPGEIFNRFDSRYTQKEHEICRKLAHWMADNINRLEHADPKLPDCAYNRLADNWRPIFAIAEIAGGGWPRRACAAFAKLNAKIDMDGEGLGAMLLSDIRDIFTRTDADPFPSAVLADALIELEDRPWPEFSHGKPITKQKVSRMLKKFGIVSATKRIGDETFKGYDRNSFDDAFARYLPPPIA